MIASTRPLATWPGASERRTWYTVAYTSLAAEENLAPLIREAGVGREPPDWAERHPELPFAKYDIPPDTMDFIMKRRRFIFVRRANDPAYEDQRERFHHGQFEPPDR